MFYLYLFISLTLIVITFLIIFREPLRDFIREIDILTFNRGKTTIKLQRTFKTAYLELVKQVDDSNKRIDEIFRILKKSKLIPEEQDTISSPEMPERFIKDLSKKEVQKKENINIGRALDFFWTDVSSISHFAGISEDDTKKTLDNVFGKYIDFDKERNIVKLKR